VDERVQTYIAEYNALRSEIEWLIKGADQYQNFGIALLGASATILPWLVNNDARLLTPSLLTLPFLFSLLGFLYLRQHEEVFVIAAYLKDYIRPRIRRLITDPDAWGWEDFKEQKSRQVFGKGPLGLLSTSRMVLVLRSSLFLVPSVVCIAIVASTGFQLDLHKVIAALPDAHASIIVVSAAWCAVDGLLVLLFFLHLWMQGDLSERILRSESEPARQGVSR